jgi:hypothetical protein
MRPVEVLVSVYGVHDNVVELGAGFMEITDQ